jgi:hypothetical protein
LGSTVGTHFSLSLRKSYREGLVNPYHKLSLDAWSCSTVRHVHGKYSEVEHSSQKQTKEAVSFRSLLIYFSKHYKNCKLTLSVLYK